MAHEQQQQQQQQQEKEKQESPLGVAGDGKEDLQRDGRAEVVGAEPRAQTAPQGRAPAQNSGKERRRDFLRHRHSSGGRGTSADTAASARSVNLNGLSDLLRSMEDDIANVGRRLDGTGGFNSSDDIAENLAEDDAEMVASAAVSLGVNGSHDNDEDNLGNDAGDVASADMSHIDDGDDAPFAGAQASRRRPDPMNDMPMFPTWFGRSVSDFTNGIASPRSFDDAQSDETKSLGKDHRSSDDSDSVNVSDSIARTRTSVGPSVRRVYSPVSQLRKTLKRTHSTGDVSNPDQDNNNSSSGDRLFLSFPLRRASTADSSAAGSSASNGAVASPTALAAGLYAQERNRRGRSWSASSNIVLEQFLNFEDDLNDVHAKLYVDFTSPEALILLSTKRLQQFKVQLCHLEESLQDLASIKIASIDLTEVTSGRRELDVKRISLLRRCREYLDHSKDIRVEVTRILKARVDFDQERIIRLFTATWNVGNQAPDPSELERWIPRGGGENDVLAIGLQECEYDLTQDMRKTVTSGQMQRKMTRQDLEKLGAHARFGSGVLTASHKHNRLGAYTLYYRLKFENGLKKTITSNVGIHVSSIILDHIGPEWALVRESELAQMRLFVFAKKAHLHAISDVQYASEATGVGGIGANKGGVAASFTMYGMRMGWISCHLAAHKKQRYLKARNNDLAEIFMSFDKKLSSRWYNLTSVLDHIFLLGDLNYRIDLGLAGLVPTSAVKMVQRLPTDSSMQSYLSSNGAVRATARTASSSSASLITPSSKAKSSSGAQKQQTTSANALSRFSSSEACEDDCESDDGSAVFKPESGDLIVEIKADVSAAESGDRPQIQSTPSRHTDSTMEEWNRVTNLIFKRDWATLHAADQLRAEMKARRVLTSFQEGTMNFAPTFKVMRDKPFSAYVFQRCPSYCDRILWHSLPGMRERIKQLRLEACHDVTTSDHKPVVAEFVMKIREAHPGLPLQTLDTLSEEVIGNFAPELRDRLENLHKDGGFQVGKARHAREQSPSDDKTLAHSDKSDGGLRTDDSEGRHHHHHHHHHSHHHHRHHHQQKQKQHRHHRRSSSLSDKKKAAMEAELWGSGDLPSKKSMRAYAVSDLEEPIPPGGMRIRITNFKVKDLTSRDYDGQASPFVVFCSPNLFTPRQLGYNPKRGAAHTPVLRHRLSAEWSDDQIPEIPCPLVFAKASQMRRCHLVFAVWDLDSVSREHSLGQGNLGLGPIADEYERRAEATNKAYGTISTDPIVFATPILMNGRQAGIVSGSIQLLGPDWTDHKLASARAAPVAKPHKPHKPVGCCTVQ